MIHPELLAILVCPETHQDVPLGTPNEVGHINAAIGQGQVKTAAGAPVKVPVEGALIRADRAIAYPIRDGFPVMLVDEGLAIAQLKFHADG